MKSALYILLRDTQLQVWRVSPAGNALAAAPPFSLIKQWDAFGPQAFAEFQQLLQQQALPCGRHYYGFSLGSRNMPGFDVWHRSLKGAHKLGLPAIQLRFANYWLRLAERYRTGRGAYFGVVPNDRLAMQYYREALSWWPHPGAQLSLAYGYAYGVGIEADVQQAMTLFKAVTEVQASQFHPQRDTRFLLPIYKGEAYYFLGLMHQQGPEDAQNHTWARHYFALGELCGNTRCTKALADLK